MSERVGLARWQMRGLLLLILAGPKWKDFD